MGRMDKKKSKKRRSLSPVTRLILKVLGFCALAFLALGFTLLPGVSKKLDFSVRHRTERLLDAAFPKYEVETVNANPRLEVDNILTIGFIKKTEIEQIAQQRGTQTGYLSLKFNQARFRIRELFILPHIILFSLFIFTPISLLKKGLAWLGSAAVLYGLLALKIMGMFRYEAFTAYARQAPTGWLYIIPYFSSPGLVFFVVILLWLSALILIADRKKLMSLLPDL